MPDTTYFQEIKREDMLNSKRKRHLEGDSSSNLREDRKFNCDVSLLFRNWETHFILIFRELSPAQDSCASPPRVRNEFSLNASH